MDNKKIASELVRIAKELTASGYAQLNPRKVTELAESIAAREIGWSKVAKALEDGYEFVLTRESNPADILDKVKGLSSWDLMKISNAPWASSSVSVVKGRGRRKRELDRELDKIGYGKSRDL